VGEEQQEAGAGAGIIGQLSFDSSQLSFGQKLRGFFKLIIEKCPMIIDQ
jgi:hypothetical protein